MQKQFWKKFIRSPQYEDKELSKSSEENTSQINQMKMLQKLSHQLTYERDNQTITLSLKNPEIKQKTNPSQKNEASFDQFATTNSGKKKPILHIPTPLQSKHSHTLSRQSNKQSQSLLRYSKYNSSLHFKPLSSIKYSEIPKRNDKPQQNNQNSKLTFIERQIILTQPKINNQVLYQMVTTLKQVRQIEKQNLKTNQKILQYMLQNRSSISRKSNKKQTSTAKKKIKVLQQKINKFNDKLNECVKIKQDLKTYVRENKNNLTKIKNFSAYK